MFACASAVPDVLEKPRREKRRRFFCHLCPTLLLAGEAEREPERQRHLLQAVLHDELVQARRDVVEELLPRAQHDLARDGEHLGYHGELLVLTNVDAEDAKVGAAEVEREEAAGLLSGGQVPHVGRVALDGRLLVGLGGESLVDGEPHPLLDDVDVVVVDDEVAAEVLDPAPVLSDELRLVRSHRDRLHPPEDPVLRRDPVRRVGFLLHLALVVVVVVLDLALTINDIDMMFSKLEFVSSVKVYDLGEDTSFSLSHGKVPECARTTYTKSFQASLASSLFFHSKQSRRLSPNTSSYSSSSSSSKLLQSVYIHTYGTQPFHS